MKRDSELEGFSEDKLKEILLKMRIFQLGLSVMAASGLLSKDYMMKDLTDLLSSTADDIILSARMK